MNFTIDPTALQAGVTEAYGLDPNSADYSAKEEAALAEILPVLDLIDKTNDGIIQSHEVVNVVRDIYNGHGDYVDLGFDRDDIDLVAKALDAMNNMGSVDVSDFVV